MRLLSIISVADSIALRYSKDPKMTDTDQGPHTLTPKSGGVPRLHISSSNRRRTNRMRATRDQQHPYKRSSDQDGEKSAAKDGVVDFTTDNVFDTTKDGK
ncbi:hypothetical protein V7S43_012894 [Phytophthora oleae]|uniref:RxLR effector protein n=1 Tax=Phytophthora oleae TaxID=2107226 RepID=A0ABD3FAP6_9STRA